MQIDVRYFAAAREAAGLDRERVELDEGASVGVLRGALLRRHPALEAVGPGLRFAVGERFAPDDASLADGDLVALIPPVSGG